MSYQIELDRAIEQQEEFFREEYKKFKNGDDEVRVQDLAFREGIIEGLTEAKRLLEKNLKKGISQDVREIFKHKEVGR